MKAIILRLGFLLACLLLIQCTAPIPSTEEPDPALFPVQAADTITPTVTVTPTPTATLPATVFFDALNGKSDCFSGASKAYRKVTAIDQFEIVNILGKNDDQGEWALIRWGSYDCWIEASFLPKYREYRGNLQVLPTPPPPTAILIGPTKTRKPQDDPSPGSTPTQGQNNSQAQTAQAAQAQTAQAAQGQTAQAAQAKTAQAAQAQTAQAAQAQTAQAAQAQTAQAAQAQTAKAAQALTSQALTNQAFDSNKKQCKDQKDNDNDGFIDFPADTGCENPGDDSE